MRAPCRDCGIFILQIRLASEGAISRSTFWSEKTRENPYICNMDQAKTLMKASLQAGRDLLRPLAPADAPAGPDTARDTSRQPLATVPIRSIGPAERDRVANHLLALDARDRYLRFGYAATDEHVRRYVTGLDFDRDEIFGIYNRNLELIAMAHLAFSVDPQCASCAEFGVSVNAQARGRGYGGRLFDRAVMHARNQGVTMIFIHALTENTTMLKIAHAAGATVERDGSESEAYLTLPAATLDSRMAEMVEHRFAEVNYTLKAQAKYFREILAGVQEVRQGVREARHKTGG